MMNRSAATHGLRSPVSMRRLVLLSGALGLLTLSAPAAAQEAGAREHFQRGVELFDEGRPDAALAEFEAAYRIAPSYPVLFNLAQVHAQLGHAVEAADSYERYLAEGGVNIAAPRRAQAERELEVQRGRIGVLTIEVEVEGASVSVDGSFVARTPLAEPIRVSVGDHLVEVTAGGYQAMQRRVTVAGGETLAVEFSLSETGAARGSLRLTTALRDVEISIDGEVVGRTPLEGSLSVQPGLREVRATRAGYHPFRRSVEIGMGAEAELALELEVDTAAHTSLGRLLVHAPLDASVYVDGVLAADPSLPLTLPVGDHELRVETPSAIASIERVQVEAEALVDARPALRYTPAARAARLADVNTTRTLGATFAIAGAVVMAAGMGITIWNEVRREELQFDERRALITTCSEMRLRPPDECFGPVIPVGTPLLSYADEIDQSEDEFNADVAEFNALSAVGYTLIGVGAVGLLVSIVVLVTTPSDEEVSTIQVGLGPGGVSLAGTF